MRFAGLARAPCALARAHMCGQISPGDILSEVVDGRVYFVARPVSLGFGVNYSHNISNLSFIINNYCRSIRYTANSFQFVITPNDCPHSSVYSVYHSVNSIGNICEGQLKSDFLLRDSDQKTTINICTSRAFLVQATLFLGSSINDKPKAQSFYYYHCNLSSSAEEYITFA